MKLEHSQANLLQLVICTLNKKHKNNHPHCRKSFTTIFSSANSIFFHIFQNPLVEYASYRFIIQLILGSRHGCVRRLFKLWSTYFWLYRKIWWNSAVFRRRPLQLFTRNTWFIYGKFVQWGPQVSFICNMLLFPLLKRKENL